MHNFVVKHVRKDQGPMVDLLPEILKTPFSFTSKVAEAQEAAKGALVYVIESLLEDGVTIYRLGYRYRARECHSPAGGSLWRGEFKYKNTISYGVSSEGVYFNEPVNITNLDFIEWYKGQIFGMTKVPQVHRIMLDEMLSDPLNHAVTMSI